jgi:hypothetical protein
MISEAEVNGLEAIAAVVESLPPEEAAMMLFAALIGLFQMNGVKPLTQIRTACAEWEKRYGDTTELSWGTIQ